MSDVSEIANELYRYAELVDAGRFDELGELLEHCTLSYGSDAVPGPSGARQIAVTYRSTVITYDDGTPRTRHVTANPIISVGDEGNTASVRSTFTVFQQPPGQGIEAIISGRYIDSMKRIEGRWRFVARQIIVDLSGDLSRHLRHDL